MIISEDSALLCRQVYQFQKGGFLIRIEWNGQKTLKSPKPAYLLGHDGRGEELPVADAGEVEVEDDGVVHRQPHQHPDQVILPKCRGSYNFTGVFSDFQNLVGFS